jgi:NAD-dependent dihydropyrimidine dehydrogenase PreA subunit
MVRRIISIDEERCNGCGLCVNACHEGAIGLINGKAKLLREDYCDGLGDCLPSCPAGAISFETREARGYDEAAVFENKKKVGANKGNASCPCPGTAEKTVSRSVMTIFDDSKGHEAESCLSQWPVQLKLVPPNARFLDGADLLVAADCTAYAFGDFHNRFIRNRITLIGCPKLDDEDYSSKLTDIFLRNDIRSVVVTRMNVPCCGGIEAAVRKAIRDSDKLIPLRVVTISPEGEKLSER